MESPEPSSPWWRLPWDLLIDHFSEWKASKKLALWFLLSAGIFSSALFFLDADIIALAAPPVRQGWANQAARTLSFWGDFLTFSLPVAVALLTAGFLFQRTLWRRAGMACLLAACLAGLSADLLQISIARPRPRSEISDGVYGFRLDSNYHSFPSGHCATAFASTTALAVCFPPAAPPLLLAATGVAWSRFYLGAHHPSDLLAGSALGLIFGYFFGLAARRKSKDARTNQNSIA